MFLGSNPNQVCNLEPIYLGSEFFSVSTDGQALWWDIRKLSEPTETMLIDPEKNGNIVGGTVLDFESTMVLEDRFLTLAYQIHDWR
jgi:hypothetical protein